MFRQRTERVREDSYMGESLDPMTPEVSPKSKIPFLIGGNPRLP